MTRAATILAALLVTVAMPGCGGPYVLSGRVVEGAGIIGEFAPGQSDAVGKPVPGATITLYRDPDRNMLRIASGASDANGDFSIPVPAFGAGWMEEDWLFEVVCRGYDTLEDLRPLPDSNTDRRLLISLSPGRSTAPQRQQGLWEEYEKYK